MNDNIYPIFDDVIQKSEKERFLNQQAVTIWLTGLSGSGKSTIAKVLERQLLSNGFFNHLLDGDNIRSGINNNLGFSEEDRVENIRRIAEISKLFNQAGIIAVNSFVSPTDDIRNLAKSVIGESFFLEIFIDTPLEICEQRDVKGLYAKARRGEIKDFTGISSPFEAPKNPFLRVTTENKTPQESAKEIYRAVLSKINLTND